MTAWQSFLAGTFVEGETGPGRWQHLAQSSGTESQSHSMCVVGVYCTCVLEYTFLCIADMETRDQFQLPYTISPNFIIFEKGSLIEPGAGQQANLI